VGTKIVTGPNSRMPLGKFFVCCSDIIDKTFQKKMIPICKTSCNTNAPIIWYTSTMFQNQPSRQFQQNKFQSSHFRVQSTLWLKIPHAEVPKLQVQTIWKCWLIDYLCQHLSIFLNGKNIKLFYSLPKTNIRGM